MTRSNRPGRVRAVSSAPGRLVAAMTMTPVLSSKPSISVSSWLIVCTLSAETWVTHRNAVLASAALQPLHANVCSPCYTLVRSEQMRWL